MKCPEIQLSEIKNPSFKTFLFALWTYHICSQGQRRILHFTCSNSCKIYLTHFILDKQFFMFFSGKDFFLSSHSHHTKSKWFL